MNEIFAGHNPLLEINTSFCDYLVERTRSFQDHVVGGTLDYAFDADFAMRQKIGGYSGWSRLYKAMVSNDIPNKFKRYFQSSDSAGSMKYANVYEAAKKCSERLQIGLPVILVRKAGDTPEIVTLAANGIEPCIVLTSDIADNYTHDELCYLIGCECGRLQNRHTAFNYAFTYPGITRGDVNSETADAPGTKSSVKDLNYALNKWLILGDITADRAGIICLDDPYSFPQVYASVRSKGFPDSYGDINKDIDVDAVKKRFEALHLTALRDLVIPDDCPNDDRRIFAGLEFTDCEILFIWRPDITKGSHSGNKQSLEIRCDIIAGADGTRSIQ